MQPARLQHCLCSLRISLEIEKRSANEYRGAGQLNYCHSTLPILDSPGSIFSLQPPRITPSAPLQNASSSNNPSNHPPQRPANKTRLPPHLKPAACRLLQSGPKNIDITQRSTPGSRVPLTALQYPCAQTPAASTSIFHFPCQAASTLSESSASPSVKANSTALPPTKPTGPQQGGSSSSRPRPAHPD